MTITSPRPAAPAVDRFPEVRAGWSPPCGVHTPPNRLTCGDPARWLVSCNRCGHLIPECGPHRADEHDRFTQPGHFGVQCPSCHHSTPRSTWDELFTVEPIQGRTPCR